VNRVFSLPYYSSEAALNRSQSDVRLHGLETLTLVVSLERSKADTVSYSTVIIRPNTRLVDSDRAPSCHGIVARVKSRSCRCFCRVLNCRIQCHVGGLHCDLSSGLPLFVASVSVPVFGAVLTNDDSRTYHIRLDRQTRRHSDVVRCRVLSLTVGHLTRAF
jgi:hypothetical protein